MKQGHDNAGTAPFPVSVRVAHVLKLWVKKGKNSSDFKYTREKMVVEQKDEMSDKVVKEESKDAYRSCF